MRSEPKKGDAILNERFALIEVLELIAAADGKLSTPERRFLRRLGAALQRTIDFARVARIIERLRGDDDDELELVAVRQSV